MEQIKTCAYQVKEYEHQQDPNTAISPNELAEDIRIWVEKEELLCHHTYQAKKEDTKRYCDTENKEKCAFFEKVKEE